MPALTVIYVADERVANMRHVPANLVHPARLGRDLGKRIPGRRIAAHGIRELDVREAPEIRDRRGRVFAWLLDERGVDAPRFRDDAARDGEVCFLYAPLGERLGKSARRAGIKREDEHARGAPIEPVRRINPPIKLVSKEAQARALVARGGRSMDDEAARLGDDGEEGVLIKELDHGRRLFCWARAGASLDTKMGQGLECDARA